MAERKISSSDFQLFQAHKQAKRLRDDEVSLTKTNILLSEGLSRKLGDVKQVVLLFNRKTREIGIRPASKGEEGYKLSYRSISGRSFYHHFGITERGRFQATIDRFGMLIVSLRSDPLEPDNNC